MLAGEAVSGVPFVFLSQGCDPFAQRSRFSNSHRVSLNRQADHLLAGDAVS
jgi:hypothetical protein